jgi:hypothetical protein
MKKGRSEMGKEGREQCKSKDSVRRPKERVQTNVLRHDRRQVHRPEQMNWKPAFTFGFTVRSTFGFTVRSTFGS